MMASSSAHVQLATANVAQIRTPGADIENIRLLESYSLQANELGPVINKHFKEICNAEHPNAKSFTELVQTFLVAVWNIMQLLPSVIASSRQKDALVTKLQREKWELILENDALEQNIDSLVREKDHLEKLLRRCKQTEINSSSESL